MELSCEGETMCGILTFGAAVFLLPIIPVATFVGWYKGRKDPNAASLKLFWLRGAIFGLTAWIVIFAISESFYFYGNFPVIYKLLYFGYDEIGGLLYVVAGGVCGFVYQKFQ
jgi:hypothetical protein